MSQILGLYNYWIVILLMMAGLYNVIARGNLIKKLIGLNIFQTSVFLLYISMGKVEGGTAPIVAEGVATYSNPLPHVLILTAIVVGIATICIVGVSTIPCCFTCWDGGGRGGGGWWNKRNISDWDFWDWKLHAAFDRSRFRVNKVSVALRVGIRAPVVLLQPISDIGAAF